MSKLNDLKEHLIKCGISCAEKNFTPGISGNLSARYGDKILITTSGSANACLSEDDFVVIDFNGNVVEGKGKASSEKMLHIAYYKIREDVDYIIHVHSPYLSTFACCRIALDDAVMAESVFYFGQIPLAEYGLPSTEDLVEKTAKYFKDYNVVLMANHGVIVGSKSMTDAYFKLEMAESYAQVVMNTKLLGGAALLNADEVAQINALKN